MLLINQIGCNIRFEQPAEPVGVGGGTAAFFAMTVEGKPRDREEEGSEWWLGKDLTRAFDELEFYYKAEPLRTAPGWKVFDYMFKYGGVCKDFQVNWGGKKGIEKTDLLVLEDIAGLLYAPRLMDIKIGDKTADANWKGKSSFAAWRQDLIDSHTTTKLESLRVEGFMNPPSWLDSENPLEDFDGLFEEGDKTMKKARRFKLQRLTAREALEAFIDFNGSNDHSGDVENVKNEDEDQEQPKKKNLGRRPWNSELEDDKAYLQPGEFAELILLSAIKHLGQLQKHCEEIAVPQKWIGSSVAVVADCGVMIERETWAEAVKAEREAGEVSEGPQNAGIYIFDWGRSELCTSDEFEAMGHEEQENRVAFWRSYQRGIQNLFSTSCFIYWTNLCVTEWEKVRICVFDYDSSHANDMLGRVEIALPLWKPGMKGDFKPHYLEDLRGNRILGIDRKFSIVNVCIWFIEYPDPSRFRGAWRVALRSARHLTVADVHPGLFTESFDADPFATVTAVESEASAREVGLTDRRRTYKLRTDVNPNSLDPLWNAFFEFPVARTESGEVDAGMQAMHKVLTDPQCVGVVPSGSVALGVAREEPSARGARASQISQMFKTDCADFRISLQDFRTILENVEDDWIPTELEDEND